MVTCCHVFCSCANRCRSCCNKRRVSHYSAAFHDGLKLGFFHEQDKVCLLLLEAQFAFRVLRVIRHSLLNIS